MLVVPCSVCISISISIFSGDGSVVRSLLLRAGSGFLPNRIVVCESSEVGAGAREIANAGDLVDDLELNRGRFLTPCAPDQLSLAQFGG